MWVWISFSINVLWTLTNLLAFHALGTAAKRIAEAEKATENYYEMLVAHRGLLSDLEKAQLELSSELEERERKLLQREDHLMNSWHKVIPLKDEA